MRDYTEPSAQTALTAECCLPCHELRRCAARLLQLVGVWGRFCRRASLFTATHPPTPPYPTPSFPPTNSSVPSGRVGNSKDAIFRSNEHFRGAVADREALDVAELEARLGRKLEKAERARIGVGQLRRFLEHLLQRRWAPPGCAGLHAVMHGLLLGRKS